MLQVHLRDNHCVSAYHACRAGPERQRMVAAAFQRAVPVHIPCHHRVSCAGVAAGPACSQLLQPGAAAVIWHVACAIMYRVAVPLSGPFSLA